MSARSLLSLLLPVALAVGCGSESATEGTTAAPSTTMAVAGATLNPSMEVTTPDGQVSLSLDGELPPGWPPLFPLPPGTTPAGSGSLIRDESGGMVGVFRISGSTEDAFAFYRSNPDVPVTDVSSLGIGRAFVGRAKLAGPYEGSVTVGGAGDADLMVIVLRGPAATTATTEAPGTTAGTTPGSTPS
jgi:hypothetical protein